MFCEHCGLEVPEIAAYCSKCGKLIQYGNTTIIRKFCKRCGNHLDTNLRFCGNCGDRSLNASILEDKQRQAQIQNQEDLSRSPLKKSPLQDYLPLIVVAGVFLLLFLIRGC